MSPRLNRTDCTLLIVDVQARLLPAMAEAEHVERNISLLARMARHLDIPILVTEQNPQKLGSTAPSIAEALGSFESHAKMRFTAYDAIKNDLTRTQVLLCGLEAHICVAQTALDLLNAGKTVFSLYDAISSRQPYNHQIGWERMTKAGAIPSSTESALYELVGEAGTDDFRALLSLVK